MRKQNKANILIVDDKRENLIALEAVLSQEDYYLVSAQSGEEALKHVLQTDFAVILLDVQMPGLNGFQTAKLIKQRKSSAHIPIIFITALSKAHENIMEGYSSGAVDYIFKPFNRDILKSKVEVFVDLYRKKNEVVMQQQQLKQDQKNLQDKYNNLEAIITEKTKELVKTNQELKVSQQLFEKVFQFSPNLMSLRCKSDKRYLSVNQSWCEHTGYDVVELNGLDDELISTEEIDVDLDGNINNEKITYTTKNGGTRVGLLSTETIYVKGEVCVLSTITDITEQTKLEKEFSRLDHLNLVGEMAAGIAHEVRNPMTTVIGFLQIAKNEVGKPISDNYLKLMLDELKRANGIITEFLTLAKDKVTNKKEQDLNKIIHVIYPLIQAEALMTNNTIVLDLKEIPPLYIDEQEIRQLLLNISLNGLDAMKDTGTLTIRTFEKDDDVILQISDEGCGIKEEVLEKMGTPFFTTKENGTGLGMAICYSIASRHSAEISIDTSSQGTTFEITFQKENAKVAQLNT
ncbi:hybrid sensor histidine kinase/response regulator [Anaerobacillus arseniciselenatis]|uniref:histidine kinase n=1 Tax=Anaerobacillus arseniciselenatis TaxID=85682 RepID=A0A1S2L7T7_9BACI|nr:response regulator [Anaerobacillus arseniciselenatis]OIJ08542.1 hybrid sensor histidine kinase/response regulator [Anaerobacillus arseniciselenatis]